MDGSKRIKAGDTVRLKSGSPLMTVSLVGKVDGLEQAHCVWFTGETISEKLIAISALEESLPSPPEVY